MFNAKLSSVWGIHLPIPYEMGSSSELFRFSQPSNSILKGSNHLLSVVFETKQVLGIVISKLLMPMNGSSHCAGTMERNVYSTMNNIKKSVLLGQRSHIMGFKLHQIFASQRGLRFRVTMLCSKTHSATKAMEQEKPQVCPVSYVGNSLCIVHSPRNKTIKRYHPWNSMNQILQSYLFTSTS